MICYHKENNSKVSNCTTLKIMTPIHSTFPYTLLHIMLNILYLYLNRSLTETWLNSAQGWDLPIFLRWIHSSNFSIIHKNEKNGKFNLFAVGILYRNIILCFHFENFRLTSALNFRYLAALREQWFYNRYNLASHALILNQISNSTLPHIYIKV